MTRWKIDGAEDLPLAIIEDTPDGVGVREIGQPGTRRADATPEQWREARRIVREHNRAVRQGAA